MRESCVDIAVIGGGPAGSFLAGILAGRGLRTVVLERETFPRFHIGESLLPQSLSVLQRAGALDRVRAEGFVRKDGATFLTSDGSRSARFAFADAVPKSEFPFAYQVERRHFDNLLLDWARDQGASVRTGETATGIAPRGPDGLVSVDTGTERIRARFLVDAAGLDSVTGSLRDWSSEPLVKDRAALFGHFRLARDPLAGIPGATIGDILIVEKDNVWFWFIPLKGGHASVGFVIPILELAAVPGEAPEDRYRAVVTTIPAVEERMRGAERLSPIRGARSYGRSNHRLFSDGLVLAGDAAGFLDPVFSSGVCVALCTSEGLADALTASLADPSEEPRALARYEQRARRAFASMGPFVETWYDGSLRRVMFNEPRAPAVTAHITSILAGELWNDENPIVRHGKAWVRALDGLLPRRVAAGPS